MRSESDGRKMFGGVARRRAGRDAAVVALWLAIVTGFLAEVTPAAPAARPDARPGIAVVAAGPAAVMARRTPARAEARPASADAPADASRPCPE
jgi:hypothetical protein